MPTLAEHDITTQHYRNIDINIQVLDYHFSTIDEISGLVQDASFSIDADSDIRRTCNISMILKDVLSHDTQYWDAGNPFWFDKYLKISIGIQGNDGNFVWSNQGVYLINAPSVNYDASDNTLSFDAVDLMAKMTGMRNGYLKDLEYNIPVGTNIREVMISLLHQEGFYSYIIDTPPQATVPYDISVSSDGTVYDLLAELRDINAEWEMFFDINGVFIFQAIAQSYASKAIPVPLIDAATMEELYLDYQVNTSFEDIKNMVRVYGKVHETDATATCTVENNVLTVKIDTTLAGLELGYINDYLCPINNAAGGNITLLDTPITNIQITDISNNIIGNINISDNPIKYDNRYYVVRIVTSLVNSVIVGEFTYLGYMQAFGMAWEDNSSSPFYVGDAVGVNTLGTSPSDLDLDDTTFDKQVNITLSGGDYDNIMSNDLAIQCAKYELYLRAQRQDSITISTVPIYWIDVNQVIEFQLPNEDTVSAWLVKSVSTDFSVDGSQSITATRYLKSANLNYLCFTAEQAGSTVKLVADSDEINKLQLYYSLDEQTWQPLFPNLTNIILTNVGDKVYIKGAGNYFGNNTATNRTGFELTGQVAASGNILSLVDFNEQLNSSSGFMKCFYGQTALTSTPTLPLNNLTNSCYYQMFYGCTGLTNVPELPAKTLSGNCYKEMFKNCTGLTSMPILSALNLATSCYESMFSGCTALATVLELPATTMAQSCYKSMFNGCTALTSIPNLLSTSLEESCYESMFSGCTGITAVQNLPATTLATNCYKQMFYGCSSLVQIEVSFTSWGNSLDYTNNWVNGVGATGIFLCPSALPQTTGVSNIPVGWSIETTDYLCFTANSAGSTVKLTTNGSLTLSDIEYSTDSVTWEAYTIDTDITLGNIGDKVYFKSDNTTLSTSQSDYAQFVMSGSIDGSGSVNSLINSSLTLSAYCFIFMFRNCTALRIAPMLPSTSLTNAAHCYHGMFRGCTALIAAPDLSATNLSENCYEYMFHGCEALSSVPALPATTLTSECYYGMFFGCKSLQSAGQINIGTTATNCCTYMFYNCTGLTVPCRLSATELSQGCYQYMFAGCTNLASTPTLPAATLAIECYAHMFEDCTSIKTGSRLDAVGSSETSLPQSCYAYMFKGCTSLISLSSSSTSTRYLGAQSCKSMFEGCTSLTSTPTWNIRGLGTYCCDAMFKNCKLLKGMNITFKDNSLEEGCYHAMFYGCESLTTFPTLSANVLVEKCYYQMFYGCKSLTTATTMSFTTMATSSCSYMFYGCSKLYTIRVHFTSWTSGATISWLYGVASTGKFYCPSSLPHTAQDRSTSKIPKNWTVNET